MSLDNLIEEKDNTIEEDNKSEEKGTPDGVCPICETEGEHRRGIEYKCTTNFEKCEVLYWFEW